MSKHNITIAQADRLYRGIDVSSYQGGIDFEQVRLSGIEAVYIKAGEGGGITDPYFLINYEGAMQAGLIFGFYFYVTAQSPLQARQQANDFYQLIHDRSYPARPAMDFENFAGLNSEQINQIGLAFLEELERLTGVTPMIYSSAYSAKTIWSESFARFPLWIADYSSQDDFPSGTPWDTWSGYQYSDTGTVPGITGNVDLNRFRENIQIVTTEEPAPEETFYTVKSGDTLWEIARLCNTTVPAIASLNGITHPDMIYAGQILRIPPPQR